MNLLSSFFDKTINNDLFSIQSWLKVDRWTTRGGSELGTNRTLPTEDLEGVSDKFAEYKIDGLLVIGGFEAMTSLHTLEKARSLYKAFRIPMVHLPATISNNVSAQSLGVRCLERGLALRTDFFD